MQFSPSPVGKKPGQQTSQRLLVPEHWTHPSTKQIFLDMILGVAVGLGLGGSWKYGGTAKLTAILT
jgi:hypothetical protein